LASIRFEQGVEIVFSGKIALAVFALLDVATGPAGLF
jgi:hypothetical protein